MYQIHRIWSLVSSERCSRTDKKSYVQIPSNHSDSSSFPDFASAAVTADEILAPYRMHLAFKVNEGARHSRFVLDRTLIFPTKPSIYGRLLKAFLLHPGLEDDLRASLTWLCRLRAVVLLSNILSPLLHGWECLVQWSDKLLSAHPCHYTHPICYYLSAWMGSVVEDGVKVRLFWD